MGAPVFDVVIELNKDDRDAWTIVSDVPQAVDDILEGNKYNVGGGRVCVGWLVALKASFPYACARGAYHD